MVQGVFEGTQYRVVQGAPEGRKWDFHAPPEPISTLETRKFEPRLMSTLKARLSAITPGKCGTQVKVTLVERYAQQARSPTCWAHSRTWLATSRGRGARLRNRGRQRSAAASTRDAHAARLRRLGAPSTWVNGGGLIRTTFLGGFDVVT